MDLPLNKIVTGDALEVLKTFPDESVHVCISSPPYWGLRDYGTAGQIGLEPTPEEYVQKLVDVLREVRRVLREDGVLFLVIGDSYASSAAQSERLCGISDTIPEGCPLRDSIWNRPCGGCLAASVLRTFHNNHSSGGESSCDLPSPILANTESGIDHVPKFRSSRPTQTPRSSDAIRDQTQTQDRESGRLLVSRESKPSLSHLSPKPLVCDRVGMASAPQTEAGSFSPGVSECVDKTVAHGAKQKCDSGQLGPSSHTSCTEATVGAFDRRTTDTAYGSCPYGQYTTALRRCPLKPKDLVGIPWRVAFALRADGWWLRSEITWCKVAPMPESVEDRPTSATEKVFLFAKSQRYYYDHLAVRQPASKTSLVRISEATFAQQTGGSRDYGRDGGANPNRSARKALENFAVNPGANMRNWWLLGPETFPEAHFAVMPTKLVEPCVLAGTSEKGCCSSCGAPWTRKTETPKIPAGLRNRGSGAKMDFHTRQTGGGQSIQDWRDANPTRTAGWEPSCKCGADAVPCVVLDPFMGAGTVALVALRARRNFVGIDLNPGYVKLAERRIAQELAQGRLL